jgi:hypothetical protein
MYQFEQNSIKKGTVSILDVPASKGHPVLQGHLHQGDHNRCGHELKTKKGQKIKLNSGFEFK